jgi:hypothetical protein
MKNAQQIIKTLRKSSTDKQRDLGNGIMGENQKTWAQYFNGSPIPPFHSIGSAVIFFE